MPIFRRLSSRTLLTFNKLQGAELRATLSSLSLTSHLWKLAAYPELYREFYLDFRPRNSYGAKVVLRSLRSSPSNCQLIQILHLRVRIFEALDLFSLYHVEEKGALAERPTPETCLLARPFPRTENANSKFQEQKSKEWGGEVTDRFVFEPKILEHISAIVPLCSSLKELKCVLSNTHKWSITINDAWPSWDMFNPVPLDVLESLYQRPLLHRLRVTLGPLESQKELHQSVHRLAGNTKVTHIRIVDGYRSTEMREGGMDPYTRT